jgi:hypothetical protein
MNCLLKILIEASFSFRGKIFIICFMGFVFFFPKQAIALSCEQLDSVARLRIIPKLCDSLKWVQDNDFIKVKIFLRRGLDEPTAPPKGTDSITLRRWIDSIYTPWSLREVSVLSFQADTLIKSFNLYAITDTVKKIITVPVSDLPGIICQAKVYDLSAIAHFPYLAVIEPYTLDRALGILPINIFPKKRKISMNQEYFTLNGKKIIQGVKLNGNRHFGVFITKEILSNGRIVTRKVIN